MLRLSGYRVEVSGVLAACSWLRWALPLCVALALGTEMPTGAAQPNIVFIMADDMGIAELGVTGQLDRAANELPSIDTPNLDSLAMNGLMMNNFYATPICASTRSAVMTGFHNGHSSIDRNGGNNGGNAIRGSDYTMAEMLKSAGYRTAGYGKWGLGGYDHTVTGGGVGNASTAAITHPDATPTANGFDEFYGYLNQVHAHDYYVDFLWEQDGTGGMQVDPVSSSSYSHDLMANRNLQFISDNADPTGENPFFVYGAYTIPHSRFDPPDDAIRQNYLGRGYSNAEANYASMITRLDNTVGDIVDRLKDPNGDGDLSDSVYDNTLIIFTSDNGGTPGENSLFDGGGGLRDDKGSVHEGGTRSPFIAHWNNTIEPDIVNTEDIASLDDLFATFADLAGADRPVGMDSASIAGLFNGEQAEYRASHVFEAANAGDWSIRVGEWKLSKSGSNVMGLYHLPSDPDENDNQFATSPAIANLLHQVALDEGVEADAGSSPSQTTNIVQSKTWAPVANSGSWNAAVNWSGGTQLNTRGTPANNFATGPSANWIATIDNSTTNALESVVSANSKVLGMHVKGSSAAMKVVVSSGVSLEARNGAIIDDGGTVHLESATFNTMRNIDIRPGGTLSGAGEISSGYDTTGTPFVFKSTVTNSGSVDISPGNQATSFTDAASNGGFEMGSGNPFSQTDSWDNFGGDQSRNARNQSNPSAGSSRGIVGVSSTGAAVSPSQITDRSITAGDVYSLEFKYAGASGWDIGSDEVRVAVYYEDNGTPVDLYTVEVNPTLNFATGYDQFSATLPAISDTNAVGKSLRIRFESTGATGEFASIDEFRLSYANDTTSSDSILSIDGDYRQTADGKLAIDILDSGDAAGVDFDQLVATGTAVLDGTLTLSVEQDTSLVDYQTLNIIDAAVVEGKFTSVEGVASSGNRGLAVSYESDGVVVQLALMGDANLDGVVDVSDFNVWNANKFTHCGTWETGDFTGDGLVDVSDFNVWNANKFTSVDAVPEPNGMVLLVPGLGVICGGWLRRRT